MLLFWGELHGWPTTLGVLFHILNDGNNWVCWNEETVRGQFYAACVCVCVCVSTVDRQVTSPVAVVLQGFFFCLLFPSYFNAAILACPQFLNVLSFAFLVFSYFCCVSFLISQWDQTYFVFFLSPFKQTKPHQYSKSVMTCIYSNNNFVQFLFDMC